MDSNESLLKSSGYQQMIESFTPVDVSQAVEALEEFLKDFANVEKQRVAVLSYLFGMRQGYHDLVHAHQDRADGIKSNFVEETIKRAMELGRQHGLRHMALLFGVQPLYQQETRSNKRDGDSDGKNSERY